MGVPSMADWLVRHGHPAQIWHLPIERVVDPAFDPAAAVAAAAAPRLVCLDLHWHQQSHAVIELARAIRAATPVPIVLGGYTASAFDREILENHEAVDHVIRGDGQVALLALAEALASGETLAGVPNLTTRVDGVVRRNEGRHVDGAADLGRFRFCAFEPLRHAALYNQAGVMEGRIDPRGRAGHGIFYCNLGRGCPYDCLFCGGSREAQRRIAGRERHVFRPIEAMLDDLRRMERFGLDTWYNTFHPSPDESAFLELFRRIRGEGLRISMIHECLHLPSEAFLDAFADTFGRRSRLDFVVLTGSDELRSRNKDNYFSNSDLLGCLDRVAAHGIEADLCFLTGLPFETEEHVRQSVALARRARRRHPGVGINAELLAIEPLAAMNRDPDACGIVSHARSFRDYVEGHAAPCFVGYTPGAYDAATAARHADAIAAVGREPADGPAPPCRAGRGRELVQLHDVSLWDDGWRYGLGVPFLLAHALDQPDLAARFTFEHRRWRAGRPGGRDPDAGEIAAAALAGRPRLVGLTLTTWSEKLLREVARRIKREAPGIPVVAGGPLATGRGPELLAGEPALDAVVCGYGEAAFVALLQGLDPDGLDPGAAGETGGLYLRRENGVVGRPQTADEVLEPSAIPSPFRAGLIDLTDAPEMHVEWSRGCPGNCAYCTWANALRTMRIADRARILDELAWAREHGVLEVTLNNAALNFDTAALAGLCDAMAEGARGSAIRFTGFLRFELLDDEQLAALGRVPWQRLNVGLQTDDEAGLRLVGRPPFDRDHFEWAVARIGEIARPGVQVITALPGDTLDAFQRRLAYLLSLDVDLTVFPLQVPPGTRLHRDAARHGIAPDAGGAYWVYGTPTLTPREHGQCLDAARQALRSTRDQGARPGDSHGVSAPVDFHARLVEAQGAGRPLVQLHHANVDDAGMNWGLGVPFLIAHGRSQPDLAGQFEWQQRAWEVDAPERFRDPLEGMVGAVIEAAPVVAGFSLQPWSLARFLDVIREVKRRAPAVLLVAGGPIATIRGKALLDEVPEIDHVVVGEGERPFAALLRALGEPTGAARDRRLAALQGVWSRADGEVVGRREERYAAGSLDECGDPLGDGLVHLVAGHSHLNLEWTRGCPNQCTYCAWPRGQRVLRRFSRERITADVRWAQRHGFGELLICDAAINYDDAQLAELCETLRYADPDCRIAFSAFVHWPLVTEPQLEEMSGIAWSRLMIGLQTDDDEGLRVLGREPFDAEQLARCVLLLQRAGTPYVELMTGVPGDTAERLWQRLESVLALGCRVSVFPLLATRGTGIWRRCLDVGATIDPEHQDVVAALPTLPPDQYRAVVQRMVDLGLPRDELEIVGYGFLGLGRGGGAAAGKVPPSVVAGLDRRVAAVVAALDPSLGWRPMGAPQPVQIADLRAWRVRLGDGQRTVELDAVRTGDLSHPLAAGANLAWVAAGGDETAARQLAEALAALDRG